MAWFRRSKPAAAPAKPKEETSSGRHHPRKGASLQGTLANWINTIVSSRQAEREKRNVADRAGELYVNSSVAHGIVEGLIVEAVGTGLTPQAAPLTEWLGLGQEWQTAYERGSAALFQIWGFDPRKWCDAQGRLQAYQQQALAFAHWKLDGLGVTQVVWDDDPARPLGLSFLAIDPGRVQTPRDKLSAEVYDGVQVDGKGRPVGVWVRKPVPASRYENLASPVGSEGYDYLPIRHPATGLPQVLLTCDVRNIAEYRQDSILGPVVKEIRDNDDFVEAALIKSLIANLFSIFVAEETPVGGIGGGATEYRAVDWTQRIMELERGLVLQGSPNQKPTVIPNDAPGPNYEMMWRSILARLGMSTQRGPENVSRAYNASYSASQASIENAERFNDYDRSVLVGCHCQPSWAWLQYEAALRGFLPVKNWKHFLANLHAYTNAEWLPPPARPIDKVKAAESDRLRLESNTDTLSAICGRQNRNWRAVLRQRAVELSEAKALETEFGVSLAPVASTQSSPVSPGAREPAHPDTPADQGGTA